MATLHALELCACSEGMQDLSVHFHDATCIYKTLLHAINIAIWVLEFGLGYIIVPERLDHVQGFARAFAAKQAMELLHTDGGSGTMCSIS